MPFFRCIIAAAGPGERDELALFIIIERIDESGKLLPQCVIILTAENAREPVVSRIGSIGFKPLVFGVEFALFGDDEAYFVRVDLRRRNFRFGIFAFDIRHFNVLDCAAGEPCISAKRGHPAGRILPSGA